MEPFWASIFFVYINDIVENLLSIVRLFADDTSLPCSSANIRDIEGILNHDLLCFVHLEEAMVGQFQSP